jgi:peptidyl-prolyl cis-trans isomerase D
MITFFRKALTSWMALGLLGLIMIAFIITGVSNPSGTTPSAGGEAIAKVGRETIGAADIRRRTQDNLSAARQQTPTLDMATYVSSGGLDQTVSQYIAARAMELWARAQGLTASTKLVDGEIASIAAFNGPTGKFDRNTMTSVLAQQRLTEPACGTGRRCNTPPAADPGGGRRARAGRHRPAIRLAAA